MRLSAGTQVGPYQIVGAIGAGGMGEVYRALDSRLGREVALKVLPASVAGDRDSLARFRREAQLLASLNHPNIAAIYGFEDAPGASDGAAVHALALEFVGGETLADRLARGPIAVADALPIAKQIAEALESAHEQGIIHRDLKPANVKVRDDGTVKVLDFGLAKALAADDASPPPDATNSPTLTARATRLGTILGTAAYMAPEQARGKTVDRRADIWAFGVVLYEMLSGRRGYHGEDVSETLAAVLTREVDWAALPADTPPRVRTLLHDCLTRDPKQRLRDIGEARRTLDRVMRGDTDGDAPAVIAAASGPPPAAWWQRILPWTIAAAAIVAAAAIGWTARSSPQPPTGPVTRATQTLKDFSAFVALSRDGTKLAYGARNARGFSLMVRQMDQFDGKAIPGAEGGQFPVFSPDAQWIAYSSAAGATTTIRKIPLAGGTSIVLCAGSFSTGGADWGDDGTIVFASAKGLMRMPAGSGNPQPLTTLDAARGETAHNRPRFLPGGRLLFTVTSNSPESPQFAILDLQTGKYATVAKAGANGRYAPTGHLTFVRGATLFAVPFDLRRESVIGPEVPVIEGVSSIGPDGTGDYTFSDTGLLVYVKGSAVTGTLLTWADRKGTLTPMPGQVPRLWGTGRLSPDGRRLANAITSENDHDIWMMDVERGTPTRLTFDGQNTNPIWTPDGTHIAYASGSGGTFGISVVAADGSGKPERLTTTEALATPTSFTPDGKTLLYTLSGATSRVMVLPLASNGAKAEARVLREGTGADSQAIVSPDGKRVAFMSTETGAQEVYVLPFPGPGPKLRISTGGGHWPRWAANGRELFYWGGAGNSVLNAVTIQRDPGFNVSAPLELFSFAPGTTWDVTPDANRFLIESPRATDASVFVTVTDWFDELRRRAPAKK